MEKTTRSFPIIIRSKPGLFRHPQTHRHPSRFNGGRVAGKTRPVSWLCSPAHLPPPRAEDQGLMCLSPFSHGSRNKSRLELEAVSTLSHDFPIGDAIL